MRSVLFYGIFLTLFHGLKGVQITECPDGNYVQSQANRTITLTCEELDASVNVDWFIYQLDGSSSKIWYTGTCSAVSGCAKDQYELDVSLARPYPGDKSILIISTPPAALNGYKVRCSVTPPMSPIQSSCTLYLSGSVPPPKTAPTSASGTADYTTIPPTTTTTATTPTITTTATTTPTTTTTTPTTTTTTSTPTTTTPTTTKTSPTTTTTTPPATTTTPITTPTTTTTPTPATSTTAPTTTEIPTSDNTTQTPTRGSITQNDTLPASGSTQTTTETQQTTFGTPSTTQVQPDSVPTTSSAFTDLQSTRDSSVPTEPQTTVVSTISHNTGTQSSVSDLQTSTISEAGERTTSSVDGVISSTKAGRLGDAADDLPIGAIIGGVAAAVFLTAILVVMCCWVRRGKVKKSSFRKMKYESHNGHVQAVSDLYYAGLQNHWDTKVYIPNYSLPEIAYTEFPMEATSNPSYDNPAYGSTFEGGLEPAKRTYSVPV